MNYCFIIYIWVFFCDVTLKSDIRLLKMSSYSADGHQKKSMKKKAPMTKKEEKALVLFDDDDLPLKGKRSQGGRPKKKKAEDDELPSEEDWHLTGRIKGKLFHDEDDDHEHDIDDYSYRQQAPSEKKVLTSSNKRSFDGSSKKQSCNKKIKIDVQGWKFSKPRDGMGEGQTLGFIFVLIL